LQTFNIYVGVYSGLRHAMRTGCPPIKAFLWQLAGLRQKSSSNSHFEKNKVLTPILECKI